MQFPIRRLAATAAVGTAVALLGASPASAHWLGFDSVVADNINYQDNTAYDSARSWAVTTWEYSGIVNTQPTPAGAASDVEFYDQNAPAESWAGLYVNEAGDDDIIFNDAYMAGYTLAQQRHVAMHELGHALGLGHSYTGQVMQPFVGTIEYPEPHDQFSYDYLWG